MGFSISRGYPYCVGFSEDSQPCGYYTRSSEYFIRCVGKTRLTCISRQSLGAFKSIAARIGEAVLPLVGTLIDCLVTELTASEVVDFLPFIGMLVHRYKVSFAYVTARHSLTYQHMPPRSDSWRCSMYSSLQSSIGSISSWSSQSLAQTTFISSQNSVELTSTFCCQLQMQICNLCSRRQVSPGSTDLPRL